MKTHEAEFVLSVDDGDPLVILEINELEHINHQSCSVVDSNIVLCLESGDEVLVGSFTETQLEIVNNKKIPFILMDTSLNTILDVQLVHVINP